MNPQLLFELYLALCLSGLLAALTIGERSILSYLGWLGSLASWAMFGTGVMGIAGSAFEIRLWSLPPHETFILALDPLSGLFLCVSALVFLPVSIYSGGYIRHYAGLFSLRSLCACYFGLMITVGLVLSAAHATGFLIAWELMAVFGYLLVSFQHPNDEDPRRGYMMLTMGEAGFMAVVLAFILLTASTADLSFAALRAQESSLGSGVRCAVFFLSFFGFGVKAGLLPFNRWLAQAHPVAPANLSAVLYGRCGRHPFACGLCF